MTSLPRTTPPTAAHGQHLGTSPRKSRREAYSAIASPVPPSSIREVRRPPGQSARQISVLGGATGLL
jgi:hypothetical protein